ncbi:unnamed protein product [Allacma fusca]|uniref:Coiled-coil domain-containing protein 93 n=1 Tax=Allacma fusca TaxID=39272 RepID=A0A8J2P2D3_9HEXA|nr:unnamed protein product [Allacma fusca]
MAEILDEHSLKETRNLHHDPIPKSKQTPTNLMEALMEHNKTLDTKLERYEVLEEEKNSQIKEMKVTVEELRQRLKEIDEEYDELADAKAEDNETSQEIQSLLATYERLKSDEKQFKEMCREELERLQAMSAQAEDRESPIEELQSQLDRARAKVEGGRRELASISRDLATIRRQIDQVPNRTELREYRLRFAELYNQVSGTHRQTKQYFSLYNSLEDTKRYLEKELSLLNSIVDSYQLSCHTQTGREDFSRQLSSLYDTIKESCSKVEKHHQTEKFAVAKLQQEMQGLVEDKVAYEKCLRDLENECKVNDQLLAACKKLQARKK